MNHFTIKLKVIYLPFLLISVCCPLLFGLLEWYLEIKLNMLYIDRSFLEFILPAVFIGLLVLVILRKRIHILKGGQDDKAYTFIEMMALIAIAIPTVATINYVSKKHHKLVSVQSVEAIDMNVPTRYYQVSDLEIDKQQAIPYATTYTSGKHGTTMNIAIYYACPIKNNKQGGIFWVGTSYHTSMPSKDYTEEAYYTFRDNVVEQFGAYQLHAPYFYENLTNEHQRRGIYAAIRQEYNVDYYSILILEPSYTRFADISKNLLRWVFILWGICTFSYLLIIRIAPLSEPLYKKFLDGDLMKDDWINEGLQLFIPRAPYIETAILIDTFVIVFVYGMFFTFDAYVPSSQELQQYGIVHQNTFYYGELWRLLTSIFIHSSIWALFLNVWALMLAGYVLEPLLKRGWFFLAVLLTGIIGNLCTLIYLPDFHSGASAATWGILAIIFCLLVRNKIPFQKNIFRYFFIFLPAMLTMVLGFVSADVSNVANLGGLLCGFLIGPFIPVEEHTTT